MELTPNDLRYVVMRLPRDIRKLLSENPNRLYVGGGFIRATVAGEMPSDIDLFGDDPSLLLTLAELLRSRRSGDGERVKIHKSKNAITFLTAGRLPIQFITRWTFNTPADLVASFDFTVCQAAIWREGDQPNSAWRSEAGDAFYVDLAARRLVYTHPKREEEAGGSLLRAFKFTKRGYSIQVNSLAGVVARLSAKVRDSRLADTEEGMTTVLAGLLREVDPLATVDGLDVVDEHNSPDEDAKS